MRRWLTLSVLLAVAALAVTLYVWLFRYADLPERLPTHWNIDGKVDGSIGKEDFLATFLVMPGFMVGWVGLTLLLPLVSPQRFKVDSFRDTYAFCMALGQALLLFLHVVIILGAMEAVVHVDRLIVGGLMPFLVLVGNVLGKLRRNFWMGIRTPWTLADPAVWERTHRLGAWLFVAAGLFGLVEVLAGLSLIWPLVGLVVASIVPAIYSLWIYKRLERQGRLGDTEVPVDRAG
jgi:uncharacterized membrane protein